MRAIVTLATLLVVGVASAEACGWVLWKEKYTPNGNHFASVEEAYETKKECDAQIARAAAKYEVFLKGRVKNATIDRYDYGVSVKREGATDTEDYYFKCMPAGTSLHWPR